MTNTYSTGNPIGSADPRDAVDNRSNFDEFANSASATYTDRLGASRLTQNGVIQNYAMFNYRGLWTTGTDYNTNDVWQDGSGGPYYRVPADYTSGATAADDISAGKAFLHQNTDGVKTVNTVAELRLLTGLQDGEVIYLKGHTQIGIGGGELVVKGDQTTEVDNNGTLFVVNGKVIERVTDGYVSLTYFGMLESNSASQNSSVINSFLALSVDPGEGIIPAGDWNHEGFKFTKNNRSLRGVGRSTRLINTHSSNDSVFFEYDVPNTSDPRNSCSIRDMFLDTDASDDPDNEGYRLARNGQSALRFDRSVRHSIENVYISGHWYPAREFRSFYGNFRNIHIFQNQYAWFWDVANTPNDYYGLYCTRNKFGFFVAGATNNASGKVNTFYGGTIEQCLNWAFYIDGFQTKGWKFSGYNVEENGANVPATEDIVIGDNQGPTGIVFESCRFRRPLATPGTNLIDYQRGIGLVIRDCNFEGWTNVIGGAATSWSIENATDVSSATSTISIRNGRAYGAGFALDSVKLQQIDPDRGTRINSSLEEYTDGSWDVELLDTAGNSASLSDVRAQFSKIGTMIFMNFEFTVSSTSGMTGTNFARITTPYDLLSSEQGLSIGQVEFSPATVDGTAVDYVYGTVEDNFEGVRLRGVAGGVNQGTVRVNDLNGKTLSCSITARSPV